MKRGADRCCRDESHFDRLVHEKPKVVHMKWDKPLECTVPTAPWCLIISGDSGEFLLGNVLLLKLEIDVERELDLLAVPFAADESEINLMMLMSLRLEYSTMKKLESRAAEN
ncbi:hypothetical protein GN244_ATG16219 [Phytophthora infestans]|uniref:Uncharacterized protein n=1 Tax=Phytophthora infestans TaxID=4787 RepID=A0A833W6N9_PHYIN|nr:hypothetical protein GN244_ATG16219 [Phytophthora infestans]